MSIKFYEQYGKDDKFGTAVLLPENYLRIIDNSLKSYLRMCLLYNESFRKLLGTMKQSMKVLSENSKDYVDLASSIFQLYVPQFLK